MHAAAAAVWVLITYSFALAARLEHPGRLRSTGNFQRCFNQNEPNGRKRLRFWSFFSSGCVWQLLCQLKGGEWAWAWATHRVLLCVLACRLLLRCSAHSGHQPALRAPEGRQQLCAAPASTSTVRACKQGYWGASNLGLRCLGSARFLGGSSARGVGCPTDQGAARRHCQPAHAARRRTSKALLSPLLLPRLSRAAHPTLSLLFVQRAFVQRALPAACV